MKAGFDGVPSFSILDGWWIEGCAEGVTGYSIGDQSSRQDADSRQGSSDSESMYKKLNTV